MYTYKAFFAFCIGLFAVAVSFDPTCKGKAAYKVIFKNFLTSQNFGELIPPTGLIFSPLAAVSHSNRVSFFTVRGYASREVEAIAETGKNRMFIQKAERLQKYKRGVLSIADAGKITPPGESIAVRLVVDCNHPFVTALGMVAPSPDWIVQINNMNLYDSKRRRFRSFLSGNLIVYDTGLDDSSDFTDDSDLSLDMPTSPQLNIAPLVEDAADRFEGRVVGRYLIRKVKNFKVPEIKVPEILEDLEELS